MDTTLVLKWVGGFMLLIGWAVMYAAGVLPELWAELTIAVMTLLYGLGPLTRAGKSIRNQLKK